MPHSPLVSQATSITFEIAPDHPALPGHFPGRPIVPGAVLLDEAIERIGAVLGRPLDACHIGSAKFMSPAAPGEPLALSFGRDERGTIRFSIGAGERTTVVGVLTERPAP